jgi:hypothetical protein
MGATGMKQGRRGSLRSARRETVKNRTCRLPGGGNSGMTCRDESEASKGNKPHERCCVGVPTQRSSQVTLRRGDKAMRG